MEYVLQCIFLVLLQFGWLHGKDEVEQSPESLSLQEGGSGSLNCSYTTSNFGGLLWYRQDAGRGPTFLFILYSAGDAKQKDRLRATLSKKGSFLHITTANPEDSATYLCAARYDNYKLSFGTGTTVIVRANIRNPEPSVYQMKDPKFRNTSICLFTDFDSQINVTQGSEAMDSEVFYSGKTVLDMRSIDFKSNGAVAWSKKTDFECTGVFQEKVSLPSSDHSCNAKLVEKSFETDMNLNFQNLIVIGLRILLLKVAGYNVFMTLRLWSS